jgi:hypothetical protein
VTQEELQGRSSSPEALKASLWFSGFTGLFFDSLAEIPLEGPDSTYWTICLNLETGLLKRDYNCLSPTMGNAMVSNHCIPACMISTTPIPIPIWKWLQERHHRFAQASQLGDLMPELHQFHSTDKIYMSNEDIPLTWARWTRTVGRHMRRNEIDNLLIAIVSGNFGNTGKSKIHYCAVDPAEIWSTCQKVYNMLGFGEPVAMPSDLLHFGSCLVPTQDHVAAIDIANLHALENVRKMGKCSIRELLEFHNCYVRALGFRLCCLLGLREANPISITADMDIAEDMSIDVDDKSTPNRHGALPIPLSDHLRHLLNLYMAHCKAMHSRLKNVRGLRKVVAWLNQVISHEGVFLLCTVGPDSDTIKALSTHMVLEQHGDIARDFGRKIIENHLRLESIMTRDIDRFLRHEVLGQESYTSISDDSEIAWILRVNPTMEALANKLFPKPLHGLRSRA